MNITATAHSVLAEAREEINKRDQIILEQQALIDNLHTVLNKLARLGNEPHFGNSVGNQIAQEALRTNAIFNALEAHDREIRAKAFEDAADHFATGFLKNSPKKDRVYISTVYKELLRMAQEERNKS